MPKIFWKVFLWFWVTMLLTTFVTFWLGNLWSENRDISARHMAHMESLAASAESIIEARGVQALGPWLRHIRKRTPLRMMLVDVRTGKTLRGRMLPPHLKVHIESQISSGDGIVDGAIESEFEGRRNLSLPINIPGEKAYRLITEVPNHLSGLHHRGMRAAQYFAGHRIWIAVGMTALICLLFAYLLVRPIRQMQRVARNFGEGDLSVRSELGQRRDEIGDLAREFDEMASRIESMMESQQRLLRDVSHELRSPLARLQVALELARKRTGKEAETELNRIDHEARQVDSMIGDMLTLVRLESGDWSNRGEDPDEKTGLDEYVELSTLIESVVSDANFEFAAQHKQVRVSEVVAATVKGNASLIYSAIENVVRNAMKYTPADTYVDICMKMNVQSQIGSRIGNQIGNQIQIEVRDYGEGVPEESLSRLFEPFYRVGESRDRQSGGFGLGLSIAARVVRSCGGSIHAENAEGGGLKVIMRLPILSEEEIGSNV